MAEKTSNPVVLPIETIDSIELHGTRNEDGSVTRGETTWKDWPEQLYVSGFLFGLLESDDHENYLTEESSEGNKVTGTAAWYSLWVNTGAP